MGLYKTSPYLDKIKRKQSKHTITRYRLDIDAFHGILNT